MENIVSTGLILLFLFTLIAVVFIGVYYYTRGSGSLMISADIDNVMRVKSINGYQIGITINIINKLDRVVYLKGIYAIAYGQGTSKLTIVNGTSIMSNGTVTANGYSGVDLMNALRNNQILMNPNDKVVVTIRYNDPIVNGTLQYTDFIFTIEVMDEEGHISYYNSPSIGLGK